ncbi:hypothetical protein GCM10029992_42530 [Glycomyces albus]
MLARAIQIRGQLVSSQPALHWEAIRRDTRSMVECLLEIRRFDQALQAVEEWGSKLQTLLDNGVDLEVDVDDAWTWLERLRGLVEDAKRRAEDCDEDEAA